MQTHPSDKRTEPSPLATAVKVGAVILTSEFVIMMLFNGLLIPLFGAALPALFWDVMDPVLLALIVAPALHFWVLRPMKETEMQIRRLAFYDPLTHLLNRRLFNDRLTHAMVESRRTGRYCALMFLDLDNFKMLNDAHGHVAGDKLLTEVAKRLTACVREVDTVSRFGGDEFAVLVSDLSSDWAQSNTQAGAIAEKIRESLGAPYRINIAHPGQADAMVEHRCSASIGVVVFIRREDDESDLLKRADAAMYQAKESGRNAVQFDQGGGQVLPFASAKN